MRLGDPLDELGLHEWFMLGCLVLHWTVPRHLKLTVIDLMYEKLVVRAYSSNPVLLGHSSVLTIDRGPTKGVDCSEMGVLNVAELLVACLRD